MKLCELEAKVLKVPAVQKTLKEILSRLAPKSERPSSLPGDLESCAKGLVSALACVVLLPGPAQFNPELPSEAEITAAVAKLSKFGKQPSGNQVGVFRSLSVSQMIRDHGKVLGFTIDSPDLMPALEELAAVVTDAVYSILNIKGRPVHVTAVDIPRN